MDDQSAAAPDEAIVAALLEGGLLDAPETALFEPMTGGVSSDIWKVTTLTRTFCAKRALPELRVAQRWVAPVERNHFEVAWYEIAARAVPDAVPEVIYQDVSAKLFVMTYLDPEQFWLWKRELQHGRTDEAFSNEVGRRLVSIQASTVDDPAVAHRFPRTDIFRSLRLEPYLEATAEVHPRLRSRLVELVRRTEATRRTMIHGDVSPKNILGGPQGPIFLDAECACFGDPAFDLAFCLNHLLLKCLWTPWARPGFMSSFKALAEGYLAGVSWEPAEHVEARAAQLLPGLLLARVDGKSPVEYITDDVARQHVRRCATRLLLDPVERLDAVLGAWIEELDS